MPRWIRSVPLRTPTLPPARFTNCYLLGGTRLTLVDPGSGCPAELARLRPLLWRARGTGATIASIFLTHHHADHVGGAGAMGAELDAPIVAHPETLRRLPAARGQRLRPARHGDIVDLGDGLRLQVIHTPGHAPGHLCLFEHRRRVLVTGDMVPGVGTTLIAPPEGDMARYLRSLRALSALRPYLLLPAHGPIVRRGARAAVEALIDHRLWREQRLVDALTELGPADLCRLAPRVYADVPPLALPLAIRSLEAHLLKLEREGRVARAGASGWRVAGRVG